MSFVVSMQLPSHAVYPSSHSKVQLESSHTALALLGAGQVVSQSPQWSGESVRSTQLPPQFVSPAEQLSEQVPAEQTLPGAQALSHAPQC
jgi:hypothetical protein